MSSEKRYKSELLAAVHQTAAQLHKVGAIDRKTMREFDADCLTPVRKFEPVEIRGLREREQASQKVFASYLNVPVTLVSQWERGERRPTGAALKLLSLVDAKGLEAVA